MQGLQLGSQIAKMGTPQQTPQMPMGGGMRPPMGGMMGGGGMPQQPVVPGAIPQQPMGQPPGMATGGMGMPNNGQQGGINPALLQMLMRSQQR